MLNSSQPSCTNKLTWLSTAEFLSLVGVIAGSATTLITQQVGYLSAPMILALSFNLINHKQLQSKSTENQQILLDLQAQQKQLSDQLTQFEEMTTLLTEKLNQVSKLSNTLREIEACSQGLRSDPQDSQLHFNRGLSYFRLGNKQGALADFNTAIKFSPSCAPAFYYRGILGASLGDKKGAIEDLRVAANLFFTQGDLSNYQKAKEEGQVLHSMSTDPQASGDIVAVETLFS